MLYLARLYRPCVSLYNPTDRTVLDWVFNSYVVYPYGQDACDVW